MATATMGNVPRVLRPSDVGWEGAWSATTTRQFLRAGQWSAGLLALGCVIYAVEKFGLALDRRFMESPSDVIVRAMGLAHVLVGWLFLFTSPRIRNRTSLLSLGGLALLGAAICLGFARLGALHNPLLLLSFYGLFLVHEVRDETNLFRSYGDAPATEGEEGVLSSMGLAACLVLMTVLASIYALYALFSTKASALHDLPGWFPPVIVAVLAAASGVAVAMAWRRGVAVHGDAVRLLRAHKPLLAVYAGILAILLVGGSLGSAGLNVIILTHVTSWLVFVQHQLGLRHPKARPTLWTWLRGTPQGFLFLHLAVFAVMLSLMAIRVYVWQRVGFVSVLLSSDSFCYWTLMHVIVSFAAKK